MEKKGGTRWYGVASQANKPVNICTSQKAVHCKNLNLLLFIKQNQLVITKMTNKKNYLKI
jgi:hypothetical protein